MKEYGYWPKGNLRLMMMTDSVLQEKLAALSAEEGLRLLAEAFPGKVVLSSSFGQEDMVLLDMINRENIAVDIFTLDTGRLFQETYDLMDLTKARYDKQVKVYFPKTEDVEEYVTEKGPNAFYESVDNRKQCCFIRKVKPLERALAGQKIWVTGLRADQSANRKNTPLLEWDENYQLYKYNPLIHWTYDDVMNYINKYNVPYNKLHDRGFISIGCAPCTRAISEGEDPRAGRWWWEDSRKECGLHLHDAPQSATAN